MEHNYRQSSGLRRVGLWLGRGDVLGQVGAGLRQGNGKIKQQVATEETLHLDTGAGHKHQLPKAAQPAASGRSQATIVSVLTTFSRQLACSTGGWPGAPDYVPGPGAMTPATCGNRGRLAQWSMAPAMRPQLQWTHCLALNPEMRFISSTGHASPVQPERAREREGERGR